jgi:hypothetical protein
MQLRRFGADVDKHCRKDGIRQWKSLAVPSYAGVCRKNAEKILRVVFADDDWPEFTVFPLGYAFLYTKIPIVIEEREEWADNSAVFALSFFSKRT